MYDFLVMMIIVYYSGEDLFFSMDDCMTKCEDKEGTKDMDDGKRD